MRQRGYLITCSRCGKQEFVPKENLDEWKGLVLEKNKDKPFDICPSCARLFDKMAEIFLNGFKDGILAYTVDGQPIIFNPDLLKSEKKSEEVTDREYKVTANVRYVKLTDADAVSDLKPYFSDKDFYIKEDEDDE